VGLVGMMVGLVGMSQGLTPSFHMSKISNFTLLAVSNSSKLYQASQAEGPQYSYPSYLLVLNGSRYQMGYDYGKLAGHQSKFNYEALLHSMIGNSTLDKLAVDVFEDFVDWQWNDYLSVQVPQEFKEELKGIQAGGLDIGIPNLSALISRAIVLSNFPGDWGDLKLILEREIGADLKGKKREALLRTVELLKNYRGHRCSMFGVWGSRTVSSMLFSARNLDWTSDTGINRYKFVTVFIPNDGKYAHSTVGFAGLYGALAGMSSKGITVHEANLEENEITFLGFPWVLRLRYVMENALNIADAKKIWKDTNNTVGFNHMVTSSSDVASGHAAMAFETMFDYTAYFLDDDPREAHATYEAENGTVYQIGFPLKEALWRTNHGYDPEIRQHFEWSQAPTTWSMERYMFAYYAFMNYQNDNTLIGDTQAVNITSILGDKGHDPYVCQPKPTGSNVLSVTFVPGELRMWAAWENGQSSSWTPAACATYLLFDISFVLSSL